MFLIKRDYFNRTYIIKGLYTALLFSSFLYLSYFNIEFKIINTIIALYSLYLLLTIEKNSLFFAGFFIGIFWFYWLSLSFQYYDLSYLIPIIILGIGLFHACLFLCIAIKDTFYFRAIMLFALTFVEPFGFNWLKPELLFLDTYFEITKIEFASLLIATIFLIKNKLFLYSVVIILTFLTSYDRDHITEKSNLKIYLPEYSFEQNYKWDKKNVNDIVKKNFEQIDYAIKKGFDVVVLPETTFPLLLNKQVFIMQKLKEKSKDISIVAGGLFYENKEYKNSSYFFDKDKVIFAHKVVLVPFGEAVPLPEKIRDFINNLFYEGAQDYTKAANPTDFSIDNIKFRNAICYEATKDEIYKNLNGTKYIIATSNNAWFTPSIQPTLQKLLMRYYARKYNIVIYHQVNGSKNEIILPK